MSTAAPESGLDVTVITGMSGAGRSEAADVLEDLGFFVIDNLPPALIGKVAELARGGGRPHRYGLVVDVRSGVFIDDLGAALADLRASGARTRVLFLDASDETLVRRFETTRRRHPLAVTDRVHEGIQKERALLGELKGRADVVLDTSQLNVHELRDRLVELFSEELSSQSLQVSIVSFGYKHGLPLDVDLVFDCRFLPNPHWIDELRPLDGRDASVRDYVLGQPETQAFLEELRRLFELTLPAYEREGKSYLSIAVGCTGGRHRSVAIAEELGELLVRSGPTPRSATGTSTVSDGLTPGGPHVVALGGGHGLAMTLRGVRRYAGEITAVASVADDGGSTGRLRRDFGVPAPGDLRKCLVALAGEGTVWPEAFEHRFRAGDLEGHALGNLVIVGLAESLGDFCEALDEAGRLLNAVGRVLPATTEPVVLKADIEGEAVEGQVAVQNSAGRIRRVGLIPNDAPASADALDAVRNADQIVLAPGSLYTSLVPVLCVLQLREELAQASAPVVQVCNLGPQIPETNGLDANDHLRAVLEHGGRVDRFLYQRDGLLAANEDAIRRWGVEPVAASVARPDGLAHDPLRLAEALRALL